MEQEPAANMADDARPKEPPAKSQTSATNSINSSPSRRTPEKTSKSHVYIQNTNESPKEDEVEGLKIEKKREKKNGLPKKASDTNSTSHSRPNREDAKTDDAYESSEAETVILEPLQRKKRMNGGSKRTHGRISSSEEDNENSDSESEITNSDDSSQKKGAARHKFMKYVHPGFRKMSNGGKARSASPADKPVQAVRKDGRPIRDASGRLLLQKLCDKGDYSRVQGLVESGVDVNDRDYAGNTALHDAALKGHLDIVKLLLENGAIIDIRSGVADLDTPLIDAASRGHVDVVEYLLERGADPRILNAQGKSALDFVLDEDDDEEYDRIAAMLKESVAKHRGRKRRDSDGEEDTLHSLSYEPEHSVTGTFPRSEQHGGAYKRGNGNPAVSASGSADESDTPSNGGVGGAARRRGGARNHSIRNDLLWMDLTTKTGREQVYKKAADGDIQYVGRFLEEGWQPDGDCLVLAAKHGHTEIVGLLLAFGVSSDSLNEDGHTAIHETIGRGHIETIKLLLDSGSDPCWKDKDGKSYYDLAKEALGDDEDETFLINNAIRKKKGLPLKTRPALIKKEAAPENEQDEARKVEKQLLQKEKERISSKESDREKSSETDRKEKERQIAAAKERERNLKDKERERERAKAKEIKEKERKREKEKEKEREREREQERENEKKRELEMAEARKKEQEERERLKVIEEERTAKERQLDNGREEREREAQAQKEEERRQKLKIIAKQRGILEAQKEKERKERQKQMLKNLEEEEKRRAEKRQEELEEAAKRRQEEAKALEKQRLLEAELEVERKQKLQKRREVEQRRQFPYGLRTAVYKRRDIREMAVFLPLVSRSFGTTEYFLDIQVSLILGLANLYEAYPDLSKKLVTGQEKDNVWHVVMPWMTRQIVPFDENVLPANLLHDRMNEKKKFVAMPMFWLKVDEVKDVLKKDYAELYSVLPFSVISLDISESLASKENALQNSVDKENETKGVQSDINDINLPLKLRLKLHGNRSV